MATKKYDVVGLGRSYVDIVGSVPQGFAASFDIPADNGLRVSPERLEEIRIKAAFTDVELMPGGAVANTMAGVALLGGKAGFFGKFLPDSKMGKLFGDDLKSRGIDLLCKPEEGIEYTSYAPALCLILEEPDKKSYMAYNPGCADDYRTKDFARFNFSEARYFVIETHSLRGSPFQSEMIGAIEAAKAKDCKIVFTLHDVRSWQVHSDLAKNVIAPLADIILCTRDEMRDFMQVEPIPKDEKQLVITAMDIDGSYANLNKESIHVPAQPSAAGKVGAGDQYLAGLLVGLARDLPLEKCMELGTQSAVAILEERGARPKLNARPKPNSSLRHLFERHLESLIMPQTPL